MTKSRTNADNALADIVGVTAGTGITGGGTSGTVTVTNDMATAIAAKGDLIVGTANDAYAALTAGTNEQRLVADSATATGLKYVADTTNYAIAAKGDILAGTAADTVAALTVGANNTVLTADSSTATGLKWATPAAGGMTELASGTLSGASVSINSISQDYRDLRLVISQYQPATDNAQFRVRLNGNTATVYAGREAWSGYNLDFSSFNSFFDIGPGQDSANVSRCSIIWELYEYSNGDVWKNAQTRAISDNATSWEFNHSQQLCLFGSNTAVTSITMFPDTGNFSSGSYKLYGVK